MARCALTIHPYSLANPFLFDDLTLLKIDINKNDLIDEEDIIFLEHIYKFSNPYLSEQIADKQGAYFPRPREFFKYLPKYEYIQRPLYSLNHDIIKTLPFSFLKNYQFQEATSFYEEQLLHEIYNEALRFSFAYALRVNKLTKIERDYSENKIQHCETLFEQKKYFPLLLNLISLVEDAETLTVTIANINGIYYVVSINPKLILGNDGL